MTNRTRIYLTFSASIGFVMFFIPGAHASVLYSQLNHSTIDTTNQTLLENNAVFIDQQLGTGLSGTVSSIDLRLSGVYPIPQSSPRAFVYLKRCDDSTEFMNCVSHESDTVDVPIVSGDNLYTFNFNSPIALNSGKYYFIIITDSDNGSFCLSNYPSCREILPVGSSSFSSYVNGGNDFCEDLNRGAPLGYYGCDNVSDIYFSLNGANAVVSPTHIVSETSPEGGTTTTSDTVTFSGLTYQNYGDGYDRVGIDLQDTTTGFTYDTSSVVDTISSAGSHAYFNAFGQLISGDGHQWRLKIYSSTGAVLPIYGGWQVFYVVNNPTIQSINTSVLGLSGLASVSQSTSSGSFTFGINISQVDSLCGGIFPVSNILDVKNGVGNSLCKVVAILVVPTQDSVDSVLSVAKVISHKIPFSFASDVFAIVSSGSDNLDTTNDYGNFATMSFNFTHVASLGSYIPSTFTFMSLGLLEKYISPTQLSYFRLTIVVVAWLEFVQHAVGVTQSLL